MDHRLQSTIPGLFVAGKANATYHGVNRLGANSLLAACVDGTFTIPHVITDYLSIRLKEPLIDVEDSTLYEALERTEKWIDRASSAAGTMSTKNFHCELEELMYESCGATRSRRGLIRGAHDIRQIRTALDKDMRVTGAVHEFNQDLVEAVCIRGFPELAELMYVDALHRKEPCGVHLRVEHVTADEEARRDDEERRCVSAWESRGWD